MSNSRLKVSVLIHGVLAILFFYYIGLILGFNNFIDQHIVIHSMITISALILFFYAYIKLLPEKYESQIGLWAGFFPVLLLMIVFLR